MSIFKTFGKNPSGKDLLEIIKSPQYRDGIFQNEHITPMLSPDSSYMKVTRDYFNRPKNASPPSPLPSVKTDLRNLPFGEPVIVWFGHSSYLIHINGKNILVDPVFSGYASPFPVFGANFPGSNVYMAEDMPDIDVLLITHDHYDHLDFTTIMKLRSRIKSVITSMGVGSHLRYWGFEPAKVMELDWGKSAEPIPGLQFTAAQARHFSGRGTVRYKTLWSSFILEAGNYKIYLGGDSGYDTHFKTIGDKYGPFDMAILETGQYNLAWEYIHMMPEQAVQATLDLRAKVLLPVHWAKFSLAPHPWDEPVKRVLVKAAELNVKVATPMIGEPVIINQSYPSKKWWEFL